MKEVEEQNERIMQDNKKLFPKEENAQTIKNIFKMSRVRVDNDPNIKDQIKGTLSLNKNASLKGQDTKTSKKGKLDNQNETTKTRHNEISKMSSLNRGNTSESGDKIDKNGLVKKGGEN